MDASSNHRVAQGRVQRG